MAKVLISIRHGHDDLEAFRLALDAALGLQARGDEVVLFCAGQALRVLRTGDAEAITYADEEWDVPGFRTIADLLGGYLSSGGRVVGVAESANRFGVNANNLREGIELQPAASVSDYLTEGFATLTF